MWIRRQAANLIHYMRGLMQQHVGESIGACRFDRDGESGTVIGEYPVLFVVVKNVESGSSKMLARSVMS